MSTIQCPYCHYTFEVEDYSYGDCPNCKNANYYWDDGWDYEKEESSGFEGFYWEHK